MTQATITIARASAWRTAVIAVVGALAVGMGVTLGSFLLTSRVAALGSGAAYVPSDAAFYVELRVLPSEAQDASLRELLGHFPAIPDLDLDRPLGDQLAEQVDELLADGEAPFSWAEDIAPWFDGHVAFAVTDLSPAFAMPTPDMDAPAAPPTIMLVGVSDRTAADAAIDRITNESGVEMTETEHAGLTIHSAGGASPGAYALADDQLVLGTDADAVAAALDAHASSGSSLAADEQLSEMAASLPSDWLAFMSFDLTDAMTAALDAAESQDPSAGLMRELLEAQPLRGVMAVSADGDRLLIDTSTSAPRGPFAVENADRGLADEVPGDTLYYSEAGNIGTSFAAFIATMKESLGTMPGTSDELDTMESALGADLEELVSWIDDGAVSIGWDGEQPYAGMVLVPNDADAARRRLGQLATFARLAAMDSGSGVSVSADEVAGAEVTTVRWSIPEAEMFAAPMATDVVVQFAVTDDRALIGVGDRFVPRALELDEDDSLAAVARYTDGVNSMGGATNASVTWVDLASIRTAIEGVVGSELGDDGATMYEDEIQPWLKPLDRFVSVSRVEGDVVVQHAALLVD